MDETAVAHATRHSPTMGANSMDSNITAQDYSLEQTIIAQPLKLRLSVTRAADVGPIRLSLTRDGPPIQSAGEPMFLHWGIVHNADDDHSVYCRPADAHIPPNTNPRPGEPSLQTPFDGDGRLSLDIPQDSAPAGVVFLVFIRGSHNWREQWFKKIDGDSFYIDLTPALSAGELDRRVKATKRKKEEEQRRKSEAEKKEQEEQLRREELKKHEKQLSEQRELDAQQFLSQALKPDQWRVFSSLNEVYEFGNFYVRVLIPTGNDDETNAPAESGADGDAAPKRSPGQILVASTLALEGSDIILHWGVKKGRQAGWSAPGQAAFPPQTVTMPDGKAVQTTMAMHGDNGLRVATIRGLDDENVGLFCVIHAPDAPGHLQWIKGAKGGDMYVPVIPPPPLPGLSKENDVSDICKTILDQVIEREMEYGSWTLMHRYGFARHLVDSVIGQDQDCWGALYVWMRYSQIRVLDWQRKYNTQPRQLSWAQLSFVTLLAAKFRDVPGVRWLTRLVMSCVGRGGSGDLGQRIRDDILVILRHNREWKHGSMMEQWHQKLHNNTSPDDVVICDALMTFWRNNGDMGGYWDVIYSNGLTRERMASYEQPITTEPDFQGHLKGTMLHELGRYGDLLRQVHLGTDLNFIVGRCQAFMEGGVRDSVNHFMHDRHSSAPLMALLYDAADAREKLGKQVVFSNHLNDENRRDLVFLDLAMESEMRRLVESTHGTGHDGTLWSHLAAIKAAAVALKCSEAGLKTEGELERAIHDINAVIDRLGQEGESHDVGLRAAAGMTIMKGALTEIVDRYAKALGPLSKCLGVAFGADKMIVNTFVEEAVRGGPAFTLSTLLRKADPAVRRVANLGPFSVISPFEKETKGPVVVFDKLRESAGATFKRGTVVIANSCDGDEDVPENTAYVVIGSTVDVLSHVSVRARNEHHGLVACLDEDKLAELRNLHGCIVKAKLTGDDLRVTVVDDSGRTSPSVGVHAVMKRIKSSGLITPPSGMQTPPGALFAKMGLDARAPVGGTKKKKVVDGTGGMLLTRQLSERSMRLLGQKKQAIGLRQLAASWAIRPSEFTKELVGGKSLNLQRLVALGLPEWINTPISVAIPNGAMRKAMNRDTNKALKEEYERLLGLMKAAKPGDVKLCRKLREVIMGLEAPEGLNEAIRGLLDDLGCDNIDDAMPGAWYAIKRVWASMWNERAHLARAKIGLNVEDVDMAVLCQKIIDAEYAFVIHTTNPLTNDTNEIYAEAVVGLGETLVSNAPGQALGFTVRKDEDLDSVSPIVRSYPSKKTALKGGKFIFRSDSNAEDLDGFAGAGLHDSVPIADSKSVDIDYAEELLMTDDEFRDFLMLGIAKIGVEVEDIFGGAPQDIEGCYRDGQFYVVQARPQV